MFSGIVESTGIVAKIIEEGQNKHFKIKSSISNETYIDQSIAHNGVCLTVISHDKDSHTITAVKETLIRTNLNQWKEGDIINLERSLLFNSRVDGHFVQGHVDATALCTRCDLADGSWYFHFSVDNSFAALMVSKGSICINGVSLTLVEANPENFSVAIIPFTYGHTNFSNIKPGDAVNIEFDVLGKYITNYINKVRLYDIKTKI
jgi:riboflavin synthase